MLDPARDDASALATPQLASMSKACAAFGDISRRRAAADVRSAVHHDRLHQGCGSLPTLRGRRAPGVRIRHRLGGGFRIGSCAEHDDSRRSHSRPDRNDQCRIGHPDRRDADAREAVAASCPEQTRESMVPRTRHGDCTAASDTRPRQAVVAVRNDVARRVDSCSTAATCRCSDEPRPRCGHARVHESVLLRLDER